jgi:uncharacterized membrane protein
VAFISPGGSQTFTVQAWSTGPGSDWTAHVYEVSGTTNVQVSPSAIGPLNNGQTAQFTVTVPSSASTGQYAELILAQDAPAGGGDTMFWPVEIAVP